MPAFWQFSRESSARWPRLDASSVASGACFEPILPIGSMLVLGAREQPWARGVASASWLRKTVSHGDIWRLMTVHLLVVPLVTALKGAG